MKLACLILLFSLLPPGSSLEAETIKLDLPEAGTNVTLRLTETQQHSVKTFVIEKDGKSFLFAPHKPITRIPSTPEEKQSTGVWDKAQGLELHPSRYFFSGRYQANAKMHSLLFFVGPPEIESGSVFVIGFASDGIPYKVLEDDHLDLVGFESPNNGIPLIIGKATMSQVTAGDGGNGSLAPYATTYDPFSVFVVRPDSVAKYSLRGSQRYNEQHYVWAGPKSREDYAVLYNIPGHRNPFGASADRVMALIDSNQGKRP